MLNTSGTRGLVVTGKQTPWMCPCMNMIITKECLTSVWLIIENQSSMYESRMCILGVKRTFCNFAACVYIFVVVLHISNKALLDQMVNSNISMDMRSP